MADASPLDREVLEAVFDSTGGDPEFMGELIDAYLADAPRQLAAMQAAAEAGDAVELLRPAHSLKSASASLGAMQLSALSRELEDMARRGEVGDARSLVEQASDELERVRDSLEGARAELGA